MSELTAPSREVTGPIGFLGLGDMGSKLAEALLDSGTKLVVFDPRGEAAEALTANGATPCSSPADVADRASIVLASLPTPEIVRGAACGRDGVIHGERVSTFVDLSTTGPEVASEVATTLRDAGIEYFDAPVSGGVAGAVARRLTVMAAGDPGTFRAVSPLLSTFAQNVVLVGETPGQGQLAKLLNNLLSATAMLITSEAMTFAVGAGLDPEVLLNVFNTSSGRNTATADKFPSQVLPRTFAAGFRLRLMAKDVELCLQEARRRHSPLLVGGLVQQLWTLAANELPDEADHTAIVQLYERWAKLEVAGSANSAAGSSNAEQQR